MLPVAGCWLSRRAGGYFDIDPIKPTHDISRYVSNL